MWNEHAICLIISFLSAIHLCIYRVSKKKRRPEKGGKLNNSQSRVSWSQQGGCRSISLHFPWGVYLEDPVHVWGILQRQRILSRAHCSGCVDAWTFKTSGKVARTNVHLNAISCRPQLLAYNLLSYHNLAPCDRQGNKCVYSYLYSSYPVNHDINVCLVR